MEYTIIVHQNIGDMIIQNGMIRKFCSEHPMDLVNLPIWLKDETSVKWMFRDIPNLNIVQCFNENGVEFFSKGEKILTGLFKNRKMLEEIKDIPFDEQVYSHMGYSIDVKYTHCKLNKGPGQLPIPEKPYAFIHEKFGKINVNTALKNLYYPPSDITKNIFDFEDIILNADEYHCVDSSFFNYIDVLNITDNSKKFFAYNLKKTFKSPMNNLFPTTRRSWIIYE